MTADDAAGLMDGLIADHQKFGGVIADSQASLAAMAPAMQAANMSIDDGRALLNLFNAAGIDAAKAPAALAKAVKELKPGQSLNDLIAQIGAIEDPTLRGQKAMEIFGAKSGIGLAQAIQPGMTSLADFGISMGDAAGATDEAAAAIEGGFGNQFQLMLKKAGGALAEFGTAFGPLVMVAAQLGPSLITKITAGLGGIAGALGPKFIALGRGLGLKMAAAIGGTSFVSAVSESLGGALTKVGASSKVTGAMDKLGGVMGSKLGKGLSVAFAAVMVVEVWNTYNDQKAKLEEQGKAIGEGVAKQVIAGSVSQLEQSKAALEKGLQDLNGVWDAGLFTTDSRKNLEARLGEVNAELERRATAGGAAIPPAMAAGIATTAPAVEVAADAVAATFGLTMDGVKQAAGQTGSAGMAAMAAGITAARQAPLDAFDTLKQMLKNAMSPMAEVARLHGELSSKALAAGLKSGDPAVRAQAVAVAKAAADRLGELAAGGGKAGRAAMAELDKGIRSKIPAVRDAAIAAKDKVVAKLEAAKGPAGTAGEKAGDAFSARLRAATKAGTFAIKGNVTFGIGGHAAGGPIAAPSWVGEKGPEIYVPPVAGRILSHADSMAAVSGRGTGGGVTVNVYNPAPEPASTSTRRELRKLALSGSAV